MGQETEEETGHFTPMGPVGNHPYRLIGLFGHLSDPGLKPEGLIQAVRDIAE